MNNALSVEIPIDAATRFGELTKREIQIFIFLTWKPTATRREMVAGTGIASPHISTAIAGLKRRKWLEIGPGGFVSNLWKTCGKPVEKTAEPVENYQNGNGNYYQIGNKVTESVTKNDQIGNFSRAGVRKNTLNKDLKPKKEKADETPAGSLAGLSKNEKKADKKPKPIATRIPNPFPLTDEMIDWAVAEVPAIGSIRDAHSDFVEYWTNNVSKKAEKVDWLLTWKKGMRLRESWEIRDRENQRIANSVGRGRL